MNYGTRLYHIIPTPPACGNRLIRLWCDVCALNKEGPVRGLYLGPPRDKRRPVSLCHEDVVIRPRRDGLSIRADDVVADAEAVKDVDIEPQALGLAAS